MVRCMTRCLRCPYAALFDASWNQLVALPGHREYMHQELLRHNKIEGATVYGDATFTPTGLTPVSLGARPPDLITSGQGRIGVIWLSPEASWRTHSVIATTHTFIHKLDAEKECWLYSFLVQLPGCVRRISNDWWTDRRLASWSYVKLWGLPLCHTNIGEVAVFVVIKPLKIRIYSFSVYIRFLNDQYQLFSRCYNVSGGTCSYVITLHFKLIGKGGSDFKRR